VLISKSHATVYRFYVGLVLIKSSSDVVDAKRAVVPHHCVPSRQLDGCDHWSPPLVWHRARQLWYPTLPGHFHVSGHSASCPAELS
jgi:hypothetical protein